MSGSDSHAPSQVDDKTAVGAALAAPRPPQLRSGSSASSISNMNGPLYMQTSGSNVVLVRRLKRRDEGTWKLLTRWFVENQIGLSFNLIALLFLAHGFIPKARSHTRKYFHLSYFNPTTGQYGTGLDDVYLIAFFIVLVTGLRAAAMEYLVAPLAKSQGIDKRKPMARFCEQGWLFIYCGFSWTVGMYLYCSSDYFMNLTELWTDWPNREMDFVMKTYILGQWAFWIQQLIVINIEERRKDHWQMFTHHLITIGLVSSCYSYHHVRVGNLILVIMDIGDLLLAVAKCLKYAGFTNLCDYAFAVFMLSWFIGRHVFYLMICWSVYTESVISNGCFKGSNNDLVGPFDPPEGWSHVIEPFFSSTGTICYTRNTMWGFLGPLLVLQLITIVWFTMIVRVAIRVIRGGGADDTRSDSEDAEDDEEEEEEFVYEAAQPLEEEVGVEALDLKNWERRTGVKRQGSSSGVSLPGHSDRKELLGRIGCEKQVD